jgi:hypothetical protein
MTRMLIGLTLTAVVAFTPPRAMAQVGQTGTAVRPIPQQRDVRRPADAVAENASPAPTGGGTVSGTVVADATGAKLRLAHVVLIGATTGVLKVTATNSDGAFTFSNLPADRYTVGASKLPYLGAVAGARRPARPGTPLVLADKATLADVTIRLPMGAAIAGTVYDEQGRPAANVGISVTQRKMQNGERVFVNVGSAMTDDRGMYRVYGLAPGEYVVAGLPPRNVAGATARTLTDADVEGALRGAPLSPAPPVDANMALSLVYFPGTTQADNAQPVLLAAGDNRENIDLRLERVRMATIEGTVLTAEGQPSPRTQVLLGSAEGASPLSTTTTITTGSDGRFRTPATAPGSYAVLARTAAVQGGQGHYGTAHVDLAGVDVSGVTLTLQPPLQLAGRVVAKGTSAAPSLAGQRLQMRPLGLANSSGALAPLVSPTTPTGEFTVTNLVPGRYVIGNTPFFGASTASVTWGLESVVVDGADVTDLPVTIAADAMPKDVAITFGDQWQQLSGRLSDADGKAMTDYTVMVFPVNEAYWLHGSRRIVTTQPGTDGRFALGGPGPSLLPAGEYYLAAVTDVSKDEQYDPAFLHSILASSLKVTLAPGEKRTQDLAIR